MTGTDQTKPRVQKVFEAFLFILCLSVIALRATVSENPNAPLSAMFQSGNDDLYSTIVSALLLFSALGWLLFSLCRGTLAYRYTAIEIPLGVLIIAGIVATAVASDKRAAITDFATIVSPMFMAILLVQILDSQTARKTLFYIIIALGMAALYQCSEQQFNSNQLMIDQYEDNPDAQLFQMGIKPGSFQSMLYKHRLYSRDVRGYFTTGNSAGSFALLILSCAAGLFASRIKTLKSDPTMKRSVITAAVLFALSLAGLLITKSKGALFAAVIAAVMFSFYLLFGKFGARHKKLILILIFLAMIIITPAIILYGTAHNRLPGGNSMLVRWQYWVASAKMIAEQPFTGIGGGNFGGFYPHYKEAAALETVKDPHNFVLSILAQYGPIGLVAFLAAAFIGLYRVMFCNCANLSTKIDTKPESFNRSFFTITLTTLVFVLLILRPAILRHNLGERPDVIVYMTAVLYIAPLVAFLVAALFLNAYPAKPQEDNFMIAAIFCGLCAFLIHNCIDFAIFEPGVLTMFWTITALLIAMDSAVKSRKSIQISLSKPLRILAIVGILTVAAAAMANIILIADGDPLNPKTASAKARTYLQQYELTGREDSGLLLKSEQALNVAISRDPANFKYYENLAKTYSLAHGHGKPAQDNKNWQQLAYDAAVEAIERYPNSDRLRFSLAQLADDLNKIDVAIENYSRAVEIEDAYREQFKVMYPSEKTVFSRLGQDKYDGAKERIAALSQKNE